MDNREQSFQTFSFRGTSTSRDAPNPLRPYYIPPSIGLPPTQDGGPNAPSPSHSSRSSFPAAARELFSDIDYESYIPDASKGGSNGAEGGVADLAKRIVDQAIWNYTSVLLAQPFEVARIVLMCYHADAATAASVASRAQTPSLGGGGGRGQESGYFDNTSDDDSDSDLPSYFTPTAPYETPSSPSNRRRRKPPSRSLSATPTPSTHSSPTTSSHHHHSTTHTLDLKRPDSLLEVLSQLWSREGAWGVWKGTNSTFVYNVLLRTIETWTRSLLSAMLDLPDATLLSLGSPLGSVSILDSPNPVASVAVAVGAAGIAGLVLAPIDMVRTRLILTPLTSGPRTLLPSLRALPSLLVPPTLAPITFLTQALPTFLSTTGPLFFRSFFHIDPLTTPTTSSLSSFLLSLTELFTKLPLETVLRRGHIAYLTTAATRHRMSSLPYSRADTSSANEIRTVVPVGPYKGIWGSMWYIVREEGERIPVSQQVAAAVAGQSVAGARARQPPRRGQGVHGLWRGWRVGFWGLVGMWCAGAFNGGSAGGGDAF